MGANSMLARARCALILFLAAASGAWAQQYPARPVLIVAPFSAGGDSDLAARNLAAVLPKHIKQNVNVLNKVGASGAIGSEYVRNAAPDGHMLLLARVCSQAALPALKPDPRILSPDDTAKFAREQFETYDRLGKSLGIVLK